MKALVLDQIDNRTVATVKDIDLPALAEGDVRVAIDWSSLNYKDALAITGKGKIIRQFPMAVSYTHLIPNNVECIVSKRAFLQ